MARSVKRTTSATKKPQESQVEIKEQATEAVTEPKVINEESAPIAKEAKKTWNEDDLIECKSIAPGSTFVNGKTQLYEFEYEGAVEGITYSDLSTMVRTKSPYLFRPFIVVMDDDFVNAFPKLKEFYDTKYSLRDLQAILYMLPGDIKKAIDTLPIGAKDSVKGLAISKISDGSYDPSLAQIKALNEALGTQIELVANL